MLTPDFAFRQTVTVERWLRRDVSRDVFADPVDYPCRVNFARKYSAGFANQGGQEQKIASGTIWFPAGTRIDAKDRLTFDGRQYTVLSCFPSYDIMGRENHVEVDIQ